MRIVIAGGGTAGCILAARLGAIPGAEIVLLEAGPHYGPGMWPRELTHAYRIIKETHDWGLLAQAGASPRMVHVPRGKVVGGSSITNATIALRGLPEHYDEWNDYVDGYDWNSWLPWFRRIERDLQFGSASHHGSDGPIPINRYPREEWFEIFERFAQSAQARGHAWIDDHNAPGAVGVGPTPFNMIDGVRVTPADTHLAPAMERGNITVVTGAICDRVIIDRGRASAVEVLDDRGVIRRYEADEVIVSLGTYASPAFLLRSGIGAPEKITPHGIRLVHALDGVGRGMQDHPKVSYRFWIDTDAPPWPNPWIQVLLTANAEVSGRERLFQIMPYAGITDAGHRYADWNVQVADSRGRTGTIDLAGADARLQPRIGMGWLESEGDLDVAVAAGRELMALARTGPIAEVVHSWPNQDSDDHPLRTVETFHHVVGTCRMGRSNDPTAVVGADCRLLGLDGISVIDASVIPRVPSANTHLAVIALAERIAANWTDSSA
jgi:choline dehydrogenase